MHIHFKHTLIAAALLGLSLPALADDTADENTELETVSVVGSINKIGVPFYQGKSAVSISQETISDQAVEKMDTIGRYQAGFTNQVFGSDTNTNWFRIRGSAVGQSLDGAPAIEYGFFTPHIDTFGVEAVEVTKGADALTYGAANAGGLINYVSKRAHRNQVGHGEIAAHFGTNNQRGIGIDYTGAFDPEQNVRYRLVGSYKRADGDWSRTYNESYYFAPTIAWDITPHTHFTLLASLQKDQGTPSSNFLPQSGSLISTPKGYISRSTNLGDPASDKENNLAKSFGYEFSHDFDNGISLSQNYRYQHMRSYHRGAYTYGYLPLDASGYTIPRGVVYNNGTSKSHTLDNRLTWHYKNDNIDNTLLAGVDYRRLNVDARYTLLGSTSNINVFDPAASYGSSATYYDWATRQSYPIEQAPQTGVRFRQLGFYLQDNLKINNQFVIGLGVRHDRVHNEELSRSLADKFNHTSYSGSLMYIAPKGFNPYIAYNESFRIPTGLNGNQGLYSPNITRQWEVGMKYTPDWLDGSATLAYFRARDIGALVYQTGGSMSSDKPMIRQGVELQAQANLTDNINATLAYTYLHSVQKSSSSDIRNPLTPRHSLALRGAYSFQQGSLNGLTLGAGIRYIGSSVTTNNPYSVYPGYKVPSTTLIDLFAQYRFAQKWTAQLNIDNLTNRRYLAGCNNYCYYGQERSVIGTLRYKW